MFTFKLEQEDADEFSLEIKDESGCTWRIASLATSDAVALHEAVETGIGDYVREMRQAKAEFEASHTLEPDHTTARAEWGEAVMRGFDAGVLHGCLSGGVTLGELEDQGYAPDDPKHPNYHSLHADLWDSREGK